MKFAHCGYMKKSERFIFLIIGLFLTVCAHAEERYEVYVEHKSPVSRHLTAQEIERVKAVKQLLYGIDTQSLQQTIDALEKTRYPQINLIIREAMAKTYTEIAREYNVVGQKKKEWLYSMVGLNMAYLQFEGTHQGAPGSTTSLNRLIRRKLKEYLPPHVLKQPGFLYSL